MLGLSLTLMMPFAPLLSGAVMVLLVLANGPGQAGLLALASAALLGVTFALFGNPVLPLLISAAIAWVPVALLAIVIGRTRSLTLALQVTVILAIATTLGFFVVLGDPTVYWIGKLAEIAVSFEQMGLMEQAEVLRTQRELVAPQMTMIFVFTTWSLLVLVLVLGYALYQQLPERSGRFGRFRDLHFGRILAVVMALASLLAMFVSSGWLQNVAFVLFAVFWVQGLAMLHWMQGQGLFHKVILVAVYVMLPFLNALLVLILAVIGYTDAWFDYRPRIAAARQAR